MTKDRSINVVGKACPMPLIALAKEVRSMQEGQTVLITGNDPIFEPSIIEFCREGRHAILDTRREGKVISMLIQIGSGTTMNERGGRDG